MSRRLLLGPIDGRWTEDHLSPWLDDHSLKVWGNGEQAMG
jgi:hypothetical protein